MGIKEKDKVVIFQVPVKSNPFYFLRINKANEWKDVQHH